MTEAERKYEEVQRQRVSQVAVVLLSHCMWMWARQKLISKRERRAYESRHKSHKDRVQEYNEKLDKLRWVQTFALAIEKGFIG